MTTDFIYILNFWAGQVKNVHWQANELPVPQTPRPQEGDRVLRFSEISRETPQNTPSLSIYDTMGGLCQGNMGVKDLF